MQFLTVGFSLVLKCSVNSFDPIYLFKPRDGNIYFLRDETSQRHGGLVYCVSLLGCSRCDDFSLEDANEDIQMIISGETGVVYPRRRELQNSKCGLRETLYPVIMIKAREREGGNFTFVVAHPPALCILAFITLASWYPPPPQTF